ncbi:MAG: helix-turn-helix domain-containing protein [Clostridia bacterium]|nr:helix-turn-helix domain-containing protein [Clostridia bacterium]
MEDLKPIIAKNISDLRLANNMTQFDLAEKLNYSDKSVSKWERGESIPDVSVLKEISDLFCVPLDYLVNAEHELPPEQTAKKQPDPRKQRNRGFITGISILLVWLIATIVFVIIDISTKNVCMHWLSFVYAIPTSMIVWLVFNSIWFKPRTNYLIISLLMWSMLSALFFTFLPLGHNIWLLYILGVPGQIIILMWSKITFKQNK